MKLTNDDKPTFYLDDVSITEIELKAHIDTDYLVCDEIIEEDEHIITHLIPLSLAIQAPALQAENERMKALAETMRDAIQHGVQAWKLGLTIDETPKEVKDLLESNIRRDTDIISVLNGVINPHKKEIGENNE